MASLVVTGAQGFLGDAICRYFLARGYSVHGLIRSSASPAVPYLYSSDYSPVSLRRLFSSLRPTALIHAAGGSSVPGSVADPGGDFQSGPALTEDILSALRDTSPSTRFVFLSSAAVYGNPAALPVGESAALQPLSPYGRHKVACEKLCADFSTAVPCAIARIFSAYGPGLRKQVLWDLCRKLSLSPTQLVLQGTGLESRDFIHSHDVVLALDQILQSGAFDATAYNLAAGSEVTIRFLAEELCRAMQVSPHIAFDGHVPEGNPLRWQADIFRLTGLGFAPTVPLAMGLHEYADWFRSTNS
ncbi:SDR family oxidoreductase [soil metagenome]